VELSFEKPENENVLTHFRAVSLIASLDILHTRRCDFTGSLAGWAGGDGARKIG
jgi:hypothetical protein